MTSRTAAPPRVTGGRPATMTRSAVQQARTQATSAALDIPGAAFDAPPPAADGWVSVDNHRRKHKLPGSVATSTTGRKPSDERVRELRRTQSAADAIEREEPPPRPNARADALSAAVTMDKKARERSYYTGASSPPNASGAGVILDSAAAAVGGASGWGSPPPQPGLRAKSPDTAAALERASSLQRLMSAWQVMEGAKEPVAVNGGRNAGSAQPQRAAKASARGNDRHDSMVPMPPGFEFLGGEMPSLDANLSLRRTQSDVLPQTMVRQQRSPTGRHQLNGEGKSANSNTSSGNGNGNGTTSNGNGNGNGNSKKCGDKRDFFFRNLDFDTRSLLQIDEVASFSVTDFEMARKISGAIVDLFPEMKEAFAAAEAADAYYYGSESPMGQRKYPLVVTDATACVGGNVLSFCDFFQYVYAIENDPTRVSMLENNLRVLHKFNVSCRCASYLEVMYEYRQDVIFFDPPWGGPEYKDQDKVDLYLDEQPLYEICESLQGYAQVIVLKVPTNFDDEKFAYCVSGRVTVRKDFKKMHLVVLDFR